MPLKIAAVLQRSQEHPENINEDIHSFYEIFTHGNRYVRIHLDEEGEYNCERNLIAYVKEMGFNEGDIILVDEQWPDEEMVDVEEDDLVNLPNNARPQAAPDWAAIAPLEGFPPIQLNRPIPPDFVVWGVDREIVPGAVI